jgi:hypothetical protein
MSTDRDVTRIVRSWLHEDAHENADRVLDVVLDQLDTTPQRRATWWPVRRLSPIRRPVQIALAAVLLFAAAFIGYRLLPSNPIGPPPTPSSTPEPVVVTPAMGPIDPGQYTMTAESGWTTVPFSFTVGQGWAVDRDGIIGKNEGARNYMAFTAWDVTHVYADACAWKDAAVDVGTGVDQMADALAAQQGRNPPSDTEVMLGGHPGRLITTTSDPNFDLATCYLQHLHVLPDPGLDEGGGYLSNPGQTDEVYIIDVSGTRAVIIAYYGSSTPDTAIDELHAAIDSIAFEPPS